MIKNILLFITPFLFIGLLQSQNTFEIIVDANDGSASSEPRDLFLADGKLYFLTLNENNRGSLWVTEGNTDEAILLLDFAVPLVLGAALNFEIALNGKVYFTLDETIFSETIWVTDGTVAGTKALQRPESGNFFGLGYFFILNNELFFIYQNSNVELWKTNGEVTGTTLIKNFCTGFDNCFLQAYKNNTLTILNGEAYFFVKTPTFGQELWITDGTPIGTRVIDLIPGSGDFIFDFQRSIAYNGEVFFQSTNGNNPTNTVNNSGDELYKTDGTLANTNIFLDINKTSGNNYFNLHSRATNLYTDGNKFYFFAIDGITGKELYISDGTPSGTASIGDILPGNVERGELPRYYSFNGNVLFNYADSYFDQANDVRFTQLWTSDGTISGTQVLKQFNSVFSPFRPEIEYNGELFFKSRSLDNGREIWKTDGTTNGTVRLKNINPGDGNDISALSPIVELNGLLYFIANDGNENKLWQSDGTEVGTNPVVIPFGITIQNILPDELVVINEKLVFGANINNSGDEVWSFTPDEVTTITSDFLVESASVYPNPFQNKITFQLSELPSFAYDLRLTDIEGKTIWSAEGLIQENVQIKVANLPRGVYFLNLYANTEKAVLSTYKVIKK